MARERTLRWPVLLVACAATGLLAWAGQRRLRIDTDITSAVPAGNRAFESARQVLSRHSTLDKVAVNLSLRDGRADPSALLAAGDALAAALERSGLFISVGTAAAAAGLTELYADLPARLPLLFSADQLAEQVGPRLDKAAVAARLQALAAEAAELAGIGAAGRVAEDPLGLGDLALARLGELVPTEQARIEKGHVLDGEGRNLLVTATPRAGTRDTQACHAIDDVLRDLARRFAAAPAGEPGHGVLLTAVGGYRATIDNETLVTDDANQAILAATIGIALLLLLCFPRPWLGVFALLPALAGGCLALFFYTLFENDISALALGFGGALISITVDQGVVYLLFVDRQKKTAGRRAAHEVFSIGSLSTLVNIGSFLALRLTGFRVLGQIGLFAALGILFSYLFVHLVFPHIFPAVPAAKRAPWVPVDEFLRRITVGRGWRALVVAAVLFAVGLGFARPTFLVDLAAMNTVRAETAADEARVRAVWGDIFHRLYVLIDAGNEADFARKSDAWLALLEREKAGEVVARGFSPSMLDPGSARASANARAWVSFWTPERVAALGESLRAGAEQAGFSADAFAPFLARLSAPAPREQAMTVGERALFGIEPGRDGKGLVWLANVVPGPRYAAESFAAQAQQAGLYVFDGASFSATLAMFLAESFRLMLVVVVGFVAVSVFLFFLDLRVAAIALLPLGFSFVMTMATLHVAGRPIDIVGLILSVLIFGMGVDYSFSFVRVYQRCLDEHHPSHGPVRTAIFLAASATMVGMVTMAFAEHNVTRSAGILASLAIGYCAVGAYVFLPPLLRRLFAPRPLLPPDRERPERWVRQRFSRLGAYPRLFARFKMRLDPMFDRISELLPEQGRVLDIGCGFGIAAAWTLARSADVRIVALEPDEDRAGIARFVLGERGEVRVGAAPDALPEVDAAAVLCLDVIHYLDDEALARTLAHARRCLQPGGKLVLRATVPGKGRTPFYRWFEMRRLALHRQRHHYRQREPIEKALAAAGFSASLVEPTAPGREETWFVGAAGEGSA
ncbi:MAG: methyltransferase domain-containing protein [Deltaproteobacteria bacterium]|nr:methyltransferase domain-containing protein [Deltaproteobacteria bacterium]